jgi:hypothetical protein
VTISSTSWKISSAIAQTTDTLPVRFSPIPSSPSSAIKKYIDNWKLKLVLSHYLILLELKKVMISNLLSLYQNGIENWLGYELILLVLYFGKRIFEGKYWIDNFSKINFSKLILFIFWIMKKKNNSLYIPSSPFISII